MNDVKIHNHVENCIVFAITYTTINVYVCQAVFGNSTAIFTAVHSD